MTAADIAQQLTVAQGKQYALERDLTELGEDLDQMRDALRAAEDALLTWRRIAVFYRDQCEQACAAGYWSAELSAWTARESDRVEAPAPASPVAAEGAVRVGAVPSAPISIAKRRYPAEATALDDHDPTA